MNKLIYTKHKPTQGKRSGSTDRQTKIKAENKIKADPNVLNLWNLSNKDRQTEKENRGTYKESKNLKVKLTTNIKADPNVLNLLNLSNKDRQTDENETGALTKKAKIKRLNWLQILDKGQTNRWKMKTEALIRRLKFKG